MPETVLVVDDEKEIADLVELYLQNENFCVIKAHDAAGACEMSVRFAYAPSIRNSGA